MRQESDPLSFRLISTKQLPLSLLVDLHGCQGWIRQAAALAVELVKAFDRARSTTDSAWQHAFLRIANVPGATEVKAYFVGSRGIGIVDVVAHKPFIHWASGIAGQICDSLQSARPFKVALVELNADFSCEMKYEFQNPQRWAISRFKGGSGLPAEY
jgi:hypothetical protein